MTFSTPKFWHKRMSIISISLIPLSWAYRLGCFINIKRQGQPYKSSIPVICVGNAIAGGSGKTPTVMKLIDIVKNSHIAVAPHILTRGYGGSIEEPTLVDIDKHNVVDVGDEALLLARHAPVIVAHNRADGARFAETLKADLIIMDDGLQNNHLAKTLGFLVIDRQIDFGNNRVLPAGPLREPLAAVLNKVQGIICIGRAFHSDLDIFEAKITPSNVIDKSQRYVAFAGLGYPEKFKNTLLDLDADLVKWFPFPDHHPYSKQDIQMLNDVAVEQNAKLITTEKDFVKLPPEQHSKVLTLSVQLDFQSNKTVANFIKRELKAAQA